jgi:hypothetical protein
MVLVLLLLVISSSSGGAGVARAEDRNTAFSPCDDTTLLKGDGFTFGLLIGSNASFFQNNRTTQVSPCSLHPEGNLFSTRLSVFRPKVDEISLLIVNYTQVNPVSSLSLSLSLIPNFFSKISETVNMEDLWHMSTKP